MWQKSLIAIELPHNFNTHLSRCRVVGATCGMQYQ